MRIHQVVLPETVKEEDEYEDILEDVKEGCSEHGDTVLKALIVVPSNSAALECGFSAGDMLMEFGDASQLDNCIGRMAGRKYEGRPIHMVRMLAEEWASKVKQLLC